MAGASARQVHTDLRSQDTSSRAKEYCFGFSLQWDKVHSASAHVRSEITMFKYNFSTVLAGNYLGASLAVLAPSSNGRQNSTFDDPSLCELAAAPQVYLSEGFGSTRVQALGHRLPGQRHARPRRRSLVSLLCDPLERGHSAPARDRPCRRRKTVNVARGQFIVLY